MNIYLLVGLFGSGKSTWARAQVQKRPYTVIVDRDSLRTMLQGGYRYTPELEMLVRLVARNTAMKALELGYDVIIDETNLTVARRAFWVDALGGFGARVKWQVLWFPERENNVVNRMKDDPRGYHREHWMTVHKGMLAEFELPKHIEFFPETRRYRVVKDGESYRLLEMITESQFRPITEEQIEAALEEGRKDRDAVEAVGANIPATSKWRTK